MPYIKQEAREVLDYQGEDPQNAGELNYVFTTILQRYFANHHNYQGINDIIGALRGAELEFYRRKVGPYEDTKIIENGDVY